MAPSNEKMVLSDEKRREFVKRLLLSRMRILCSNGFYGLLLMHMDFALDAKCETACTDGRKIYFGPAFLDELSDGELDFVMMHEILHCALQHCSRDGERDHEVFNVACDIVVNSNILASNNNDLKSITLRKYGVSIHQTPKGEEGVNYTAEQVYEMFPVRGLRKGSGQGMSGGLGSSDGRLGNGGPSGKGGSGKGQSGKGAAGKGSSGNGYGRGNGSGNGSGIPSGGTWDDHSRWKDADEDETLREEWSKRLLDAGEAISIRDPSNTRGMIPVCANRILKELRRPQTDWRTVLNDFVQEEISDYSFTPPDRRFDDGPFFLPDYNEKEDLVKDILFMIDTSASMPDSAITAAYSEIKGAIDQFNGKLQGWLGFFDAVVVEPEPFSNEEEFKVIRPKGGGGTRFDIIFKYVTERMDPLPASIIIMTDGYAPFPKEKAADGIPVLWLLVNDEVDPPWGKVARITVD